MPLASSCSLWDKRWLVERRKSNPKWAFRRIQKELPPSTSLLVAHWTFAIRNNTQTKSVLLYGLRGAVLMGNEWKQRAIAAQPRSYHTSEKARIMIRFKTIIYQLNI